MLATEERSTPEALKRMPSLSLTGSVSGTGSSLISPLAQVKGLVSSVASTSSSQATTRSAPIPALDLNLFRTASVYSIDSLASIETATSSSLDYGAGEVHLPENPETPTTPKAERTDYFDTGREQAGPSRQRQSPPQAATPTRSFVVRSRVATAPPTAPPTGPLPTPPNDSFYSLAQPPAVRLRLTSAPEPFIPREAPVLRAERHNVTSGDWASIHGEQGSDWGEDEAQFEWLDTVGAPEAMNGNGVGGRIHLSPSKRLAKLKSVVPSIGHGEGRKLKKPLVLPRRAAPPPPAGPGSPRGTAVASPPISPRITSQKPEPLRGEPFVQLSGHPHPAPTHSSTLPSPSFTAPHPFNVKPRPTLSPIMVALKDDSAPGLQDNSISRASHMSFQSVAYSFYDLDASDGALTPRVGKPGGDELAFPRGKYTKVSASQLVRDAQGRNDAGQGHDQVPLSATRVDSKMTAEDLVHRGIEARGRGDLPRSAFYFMKAAELGSATGRMCWGLALRHGWGVARDDKRAFAELRRACNESLAEGGLSLHQSPGAKTVKLSSQEKKAMARDLSVGLFEIANCFLEGVGVKKAPDIAVSYLRFAANMGDLASQEQLGFLLSKGSNGIKKDMKEAAKWYRMAIGQGSTNTFGLAWIWKDKYME